VLAQCMHWRLRLATLSLVVVRPCLKLVFASLLEYLHFQAARRPTSHALHMPSRRLHAIVFQIKLTAAGPVHRALVEDKEEALKLARSEARQARKETKALNKEMRELAAALCVAEEKKEEVETEKRAMEADQAELKKMTKQVVEKNELLTKQLKAEKKLAKQRGTRVERAALEAVEGAQSSPSPTEESDALRALQVQLDSVSRQVGVLGSGCGAGLQSEACSSCVLADACLLLAAFCFALSRCA
jgi:hypothetical protein